MQFYLIQLSYTAEAWRQQIEQTKNINDRLAAVRQLVARLDGSFADYHFFTDPTGQTPARIVTRSKFIGVGKDDIVAVLAMPSVEAAAAFSLAVSAEAGVRDVRLTPIIPIEDSLDIMQKAAETKRSTDYSAPGGTETSWLTQARPRTASRKRARTTREA